MIPPDQDRTSPADENLRAEAAEVWQIEAKLPGLMESGQHALAAALAERLLELREAALGATHEQVLEAVSTLAKVYYSMANHERSMPLLDRVLLAREAAAAEAPGPLGDALVARAEVHLAMGEFARAEEVATRALGVYKGMPERDTRRVARALHTLAFIMAGNNREDAAREVRAEAEALARDAPGQSPAMGMLQRAMLRLEADDLDEAEALAEGLLALARKKGGPDHRDNGYAFVLLSQVAERRGDLARALELMTEAIRVRAEDPEIDQHIADLTRMGQLFLAAGAAGEASKLFKEAHELAASSRGEDHPSVAHLIYLAGEVAMAMNNPKHALFCAERALEVAQKTMGTAHLSLMVVLKLVADAQLALGKLGAAETSIGRIGAIYAKSALPTSEQQAIAPSLLADVAMKRKAYARAAELFEQALAICERAYGSADDKRLGGMLDRAGEAQLLSGALARAEALTQRLLVICEQADLGPEAPAMVATVRRLATIYEKTGDPRAEEMRRRARLVPEAATSKARPRRPKRYS